MAHGHLVLAARFGQQPPDARVPIGNAVLGARVLGECRFSLEVFAEVQTLERRCFNKYT